MPEIRPALVEIVYKLTLPDGSPPPFGLTYDKPIVYFTPLYFLINSLVFMPDSFRSFSAIVGRFYFAQKQYFEKNGFIQWYF